MKLEHFEDQQRKLVDKIQCELQKRRIKDTDIAIDVKRKRTGDDLNIKKFREINDLNRNIEELEQKNREKSIKIDRLINDIDARENILWNN